MYDYVIARKTAATIPEIDLEVGEWKQQEQQIGKDMRRVIV